MNKKKKWIITAIVLVVFCLILSLYNLLNDKAPASDDAAKAPIAPRRQSTLNVNGRIVRPQRLTDGITTVGNLLPDEEVDLSFETSGKIVAINFQEGTVVRKGELLAKVNDLPLVAQLSRYEAQLKLAEDRVYRQSALLKKDAVSQEAYEQVTTEYEKLMADIDLVKANILQTELRAPFDGIIGLRSVSEGAYVSPTTVITKLTKISPLKIEFSIPERYANDVKNGTMIVFRLEDSNGIMRDYNAKVYAVESKMDMTTRTLKVRATYPNTNESIFPGRYTSVEITKREIKDALAIPSEALIPEMGKNVVYLYKNGVAEPAEIEIGLRTESHVQVLNGVQPGDTLITTGVMQLRTSMQVTIDNLY